jgi:hypothetical protein
MVGCLGASLLTIGSILLVAMGSFWALKTQIVKYSSEQRRELPVTEVSAEKVRAVEERIETIQQQAAEGEPINELILTADQLNALISNEERLRGRVFVTINDDKLSAELSVPIDSLPGGEGRYFNGTVSLDVALESGRLVVFLREAQVNGEQVPAILMEAIRHENLAKNLSPNSELARNLAKFESLEVLDGRIVLEPKSAESNPGVEPNQEAGEGAASDPGESVDNHLESPGRGELL